MEEFPAHENEKFHFKCCSPIYEKLKQALLAMNEMWKELWAVEKRLEDDNPQSIKGDECRMHYCDKSLFKDHCNQY